MNTATFTATLTIVEADNAGIPVPPEAVDTLKGGKRPKVVVALNGYSYRSSVAPYGDEFWIPVSRERRAQGKLVPGETYEVSLTLDTAPRVLELPPELRAALDAHPVAAAAWASLSYSKQQQLAAPVLNAKKPDTRERNIAKLIATLSD